MIEKSDDPENGKRKIYSLTEKGQDLAPVILETIRWSGKYIKLNKERKTLVARIENDRDGLIAEIRARK
ncbi:MAG: winged helix-turn-helix transcriptional regulator [Rhizobiales bacterium]|nr:winged helix-turn-helix transcriptional regulator [Hyphomicrobiales bacterium]